MSDDELVWPLGWTCPACNATVEERDGIPLFAPQFADNVAGISAESFALFEKLEAEHFWFTARKRLIKELAQKYFPNATSYFEVGCGSGGVFQVMAASRQWERLAASELHLSGVRQARRRMSDDVEFVQLDARDIPAVATFDLVGAFDVIEHIAEDDRVLAQMRGSTRTGGGAIVAVPQHPWMWSKTDEVAHHHRRYRRRELEEKMQRAGFEVVFSSSYTALLLPLMAASRALGGGKKDADDDFAEIAISNWINRLLSKVLHAEVSLTLAGVPWPAGGSRIVVGRAV